jgi:putative transposon-encoded protein
MVKDEWATTKEAKKCGTGAHVQVPKRYRGKKFRVKPVAF